MIYVPLGLVWAIRGLTVFLVLCLPVSYTHLAAVYFCAATLLNGLAAEPSPFAVPVMSPLPEPSAVLPFREGDEVVVCAKVMNYMGNTPETVSNKTYLVSLNGKTADGSGSGDITGTAKGDGSAAVSYTHLDVYKRQEDTRPGTR